MPTWYDIITKCKEALHQQLAASFERNERLVQMANAEIEAQKANNSTLREMNENLKKV